MCSGQYIITVTLITATSTLIDNIFYTDFAKKITAGNIATQFLMIRDQTTSFEDNRRKEVLKI